MGLEKFKQNLNVDDEEFNSIYPDDIRELSDKHWTPVAVAKTAATYLVNRPGVKVLDIGSGVRKFCVIGTAITSVTILPVLNTAKTCILLANKYKSNSA